MTEKNEDRADGEDFMMTFAFLQNKQCARRGVTSDQSVQRNTPEATSVLSQRRKRCGKKE